MKTPDEFEQDLTPEAMYQRGNEFVQRAMSRGVKSKDRHDEDIRGIFNRGIRWLEMAAEKNCADAALELADLYATGDIDNGNPPDWGSTGKDEECQNLEHAVKLYEQAYALNPKWTDLPQIISGLQGRMDRLLEEMDALSENPPSD